MKPTQLMPGRMSSHPDAKEIAAHFRVTENEVYDAFSSVGQIVGNVPRSVAIVVMQEWFDE